MTLAEFEKYAKEHNIFYCTKELCEQIRAERADLDDAEYEFEGYYKAVNDALQIIDKYAEQEPTDKWNMVRRTRVLEIIDKFKAESEDKE